jgi:hypothetical protein
MPSRIEAIVLAIGDCNGAFHPGTTAFDLANPLLLRSFATPGKHSTNPDGIRIFPSLVNGIKAAGFDIELKLKGKSRAGLAPTDRLENLLKVFNIKEPGGISKIVSFLRRSLNSPDISKDTPLSFFLEGAECPTPQPTP